MLFSRSVSTQEGIAWIFFSESMKLPLWPINGPKWAIWLIFQLLQEFSGHMHFFPIRNYSLDKK
jgi:hypothetical protein